MSPVSSIAATTRNERQQELVSDAAELAGDVSDTSQLIGYVVIAMYSDGTGKSAGYRPSPEDHLMGSSLWEAWVRSAVEKHFMYGEGVDATYDVLNGVN
jgi:hypothetical protein